MASEHDLSQRESNMVELLHEAARQERAPETLRARLQAQRDDTREQARRRRRRVLGLPARYAGMGGTAVAAGAAALVLVLSGGGGALSIAEAATLATRGPQNPAPATSTTSPTLLNARVGALRFPNWTDQGGWRSSGERVDTVDGRRTVTVYYTRDGRSIGYSIVASPSLRGLNTHGEPYATLRQGNRTIVVWQEQNHTCLLSGVGDSAASLWKLAAANRP
jgi:hypothetical protein